MGKFAGRVHYGILALDMLRVSKFNSLGDFNRGIAASRIDMYLYSQKLGGNTTRQSVQLLFRLSFPFVYRTKNKNYNYTVNKLSVPTIRLARVANW